MARPPFPSINDFLQIYNGDMVSGQDPVNLRDTYYPIDQAVAATTFSMPGSSTVITSDYAFDTVDVYPSTDFQQAMVSMIGDLKGGYENKYFCSNRGFTILNDVIQHCKYVMFESWLVDYNFDTGQYEKITDPDSIAFNNNVKQQLKELRKKYAFDVLSLNYCPNDSSGDELRQYIFDMDMQEGYMSWSSVIDLNSPLPNNEMTTTDANVFKSNVWQLLRKYKV